MNHWTKNKPTVPGRPEETIVLRDCDGFETMKFDQDPHLAGVTTLSGRVFKYQGARTQQGLRIFTELKN